MLIRNILLILAYFASGKLGLMLAATGGGYAAPVWAPTGLSIAAVVFWGWRALPGVWIGAFLTNFSISGSFELKSILISSSIASGNTLESVVAFLLLTRFLPFSRTFERTSDVVSYLVTAVFSPAVSAGVGTAVLTYFSDLRGATPGDTFVTWWIGDSVGAALLAPILFSFMGSRRGEEAGRGQIFPYGMVAFTLLALMIDAGGSYHFQPILGATLVFATLIICATRIPMWRLSWVILAVAVAAIYRSYYGYGVFSLIPDRVQRMVLMQFVLGSASVTSVMLNAAITEKVLALRQSHQRELALMTSNRTAAIGEMASGIAHEINNPLTVLSSRAQLLLSLARTKQPEQAEVQASAEKIIAMSERITKIVRSLYFFSRKSDSDPFEDVPIRKIVDETIELCAKHFKDAGVRLEVEPISEELELHCRPVEVGQLILNLLSNAVAAVKSPDPADYQKNWVRIAARRHGSDIELSVTDSGMGIPASVKHRIFDPFFTTKAPGQGTGLGLSISREVAVTHGGRLFLDEDSANTRFVARLPLKGAQAG